MKVNFDVNCMISLVIMLAIYRGTGKVVVTELHMQILYAFTKRL